MVRVRTGLSVTLDNVAKVLRGIDLISSTRVMVGVPDDKSPRKDGEITNSALLYIHENGAPEVNIPARPSLVPGIRDKREEIVSALRRAGELALEGKPEAVERQFHRAGAIGRDAVKRRITVGPHVPLKEATILARRRRSVGGKYRRKAQSAADVTPLVDTGQMRAAVNYVLRKVRK